MECYHCQPSHPEFARRHVYARPAAQAAEIERTARARSAALGIEIADVDDYGLHARAGQESIAVMRSALLEGHLTASPDGALLAPLMGRFKVSPTAARLILTSVRSATFWPIPTTA